MPETRPETSVVEHELRVDAGPEIVFSYFTDPSRMVQWMGAEATLDPRPGGVCRIGFQPARFVQETILTMLGKDEPKQPIVGTAMSGKFVDVQPHSRIALTWGW